MSRTVLILCALMGVDSFMAEQSQAEHRTRIVIAHRGASGYLPEHTLESKALAHGMGADFIEQDVVLTRDDQPIVLHDVQLDTISNVARLFPKRKREDGRYYAIDFTLAEIKTLQVHERINLKTGKAVFGRRFPLAVQSFRVPTLAEEISLIQGLNKSTGRRVGIYPEIKKPAWHREQGKDISTIVLKTLADHGYSTRDDPCFLQCFDPSETRRIRTQLGCKLRLIQLIGSNDWGEAKTDYDKMRTRDGLKAIAQYADGIGPWMRHVVRGKDGSGKLLLTDLVRDAHRLGLHVHPYTLRADDLPSYVEAFEDLLTVFFDVAEVDGVFTDFPDRAAAFLRRARATRSPASPTP